MDVKGKLKEITKGLFIKHKGIDPDLADISIMKPAILANELTFNVKARLYFRVRDVKDCFEPEALPPAPHWQDIVFADGRMEALLNKLENTPEVSKTTQKMLMFSSQTGSYLSNQDKLVRYGMNDEAVFMGTHASLDRAIHNLSRIRKGVNEGAKGVKEISLSKKHGLNITFEMKDGTTTQKNLSRDQLKYYIAIKMDSSLSAVLRTKSDRENVYTGEKLGILLDWLLDDVLPAIPNFIKNHKALPGKNGSYTISRNEERGITIENERSKLYERMRLDYTGSIPDYRSNDTSSKPRKPQL